MLLGLIFLAAATALLDVGTSIQLLIVGRVLQGICGAIVWITGLALLVDTVGTDHVGEAMGYVGASLSIAFLLAPVLGGVVGDKAGYSAVFAMCWGTIGVDLVMRLVLIEKKVAAKWLGLEGAYGSRPTAAAANVPAVGELTGDHDSGEKQDVTTAEELSRAASVIPSPNTEAAIPAHTTAGILNPRTQAARRTPSTRTSISRESHPLRALINRVPMLILLSSPRMAACLYVSLIQASLMTALDSTLPIRVSQLFHWSSLGAGLIFLPITVGPPLFIPSKCFSTSRWARKHDDT